MRDIEGRLMGWLANRWPAIAAMVDAIKQVTPADAANGVGNQIQLGPVFRHQDDRGTLCGEHEGDGDLSEE